MGTTPVAARPTCSTLWDVGVPMRDGVRLSADVHLPAAGHGSGPFPAVLQRTPYSKQRQNGVDYARYLTAYGYAVVVQDVRGRHDSEGDWVPFRKEGPDGYDTVEWIAEQPWSSGDVATMGGSYSGWCQWALAMERPPHLRTMVSTATSGKWMEEHPFHNGCLMLGLFAWLNLVGGRVLQDPQLTADWETIFRDLPLRTMDERLGRDVPTWREWLCHPTLDDYWQTLRADAHFPELDVPVLHITGWYDADAPGSMYFYEGMVNRSRRRDAQRLVVGPWDHGGTRVPVRHLGGVDFGPESVIDMPELHRTWFDRWLRRDQADDPDRVEASGARVFLTGADRWQDLPSWPPPDVALVPLYLRSDGAAHREPDDGRLTWVPPDSAETADEYVYDPADPVPSVSDPNFYSPTADETPLDRHFQYDRDDVAVYTGDPTTTELTLTGEPVLHLFASTDGLDTDWFAALHDVAPDGSSMLLVEGRLRARFRTSLSTETLLEPGEVYEFTFRLDAVGHLLRRGHRLRLTVTSSDYPTWDRNPNTGSALGQDDVVRVAVNRIHHGPDTASRLELPLAGLTGGPAVPAGRRAPARRGSRRAVR